MSGGRRREQLAQPWPASPSSEGRQEEAACPVPPPEGPGSQPLPIHPKPRPKPAPGPSCPGSPRKATALCPGRRRPEEAPGGTAAAAGRDCPRRAGRSPPRPCPGARGQPLPGAGGLRRRGPAGCPLRGSALPGHRGYGDLRAVFPTLRGAESCPGDSPPRLHPPGPTGAGAGARARLPARCAADPTAAEDGRSPCPSAEGTGALGTRGRRGPRPRGRARAGAPGWDRSPYLGPAGCAGSRCRCSGCFGAAAAAASRRRL